MQRRFGAIGGAVAQPMWCLRANTRWPHLVYCQARKAQEELERIKAAAAAAAAQAAAEEEAEQRREEEAAAAAKVLPMHASRQLL